ncbi:hypothetical protein C5C45_00285 [Rathayibacter rathayi]|uniref:Uncharacterized protein n=1 Tax=Rathayibacter rathayi TaxID=33887 RepID=A0ABX5AEQ9_RATRA|nr:hypothetical protein C5C34_09760 [Rathayibacter rathayi]PPF51623.1 hypothetical protein C5C08_02120 [Rathayibacter rathayi]PPF83213.1 hypothetical protein C5C14_02155 [Rathayibacter rathayi]PPG47044.1 hypothetical protein C5C20_02115 [Rathayibacter rathayi]PPG94067.1 hypothetical protein C5C22_09630 [Rathayibacter rathayi]
MLLRLALRVGRPQKLDLRIDVFVSCAMFRGLHAQTTPMTTGPRAVHSDSVPEILPAALAAEALCTRTRPKSRARRRWS